MSTGEIAIVGEPKTDRKTIVAGFFHHFARITCGHNNPPTARCFSMNQRQETVVLPDRLDAEQVDRKQLITEKLNSDVVMM